MSCGFSVLEVAQVGETSSWVANRMAKLRDEVEQQSA